MTHALDRAAFRALLAAHRPRSNARLAWAVLVLDVVLCTTAVACSMLPGTFAYLASVGLFWLVLLHLYLIQHECVHRAVFVQDRWNVRLGACLGAVLVLPFLARRRSHIEHHTHTGHPDRDLTNARAAAGLQRLSPRQLRVLDVLWRMWVPVLVINERVGLMRTCFARDKEKRAEWRDQTCMLLSVALYVGCAAWWVRAGALGDALSAYVCAFWLLLMSEELINLPHHVAAPFVDRKLPVWEQMQVTHSCATVPVWSRFVLLNFNLHSAHHLMPNLPWFRLPALHRDLMRTGSVMLLPNEFACCKSLRRRAFADVFSAYLLARPGACPPLGPHGADFAERESPGGLRSAYLDRE